MITRQNTLASSDSCKRMNPSRSLRETFSTSETSHKLDAHQRWGHKAIAQREGNKLLPYLDSVGIWTVGVGHTTAAGPPAVKKGTKTTAAQSDQILTRDLAAVEDSINNVVNVPLTKGQFDALVSLVFNIGGPAFAKSTLLRRLLATTKAPLANSSFGTRAR